MTASEKTALVTGASRGIGLGIAHRLARLGYSLTITARDATRLDAVAAGLRSAGGGEIVAIAADMSDEEGGPGRVMVPGPRVP